ncbi:MAG: universal stress protein [Alphaproteobacteria bacterium]|nr:MAG: universal stress protein [Alphaproteobacteria bacterium]
MIRTILVPTTHDVDFADCLRFAIPLAERFCGHLGVLFVLPDPRAAIPFMGEGLTADVIQDLVEAAEREGKLRSTKARARFEEAIRAAGIEENDGLDAHDRPTASFEEVVGLVADRVGRAGRIHDLTIVPQPTAPHQPDAEEIFNEALFRSGRPVIVAPAADGSEREGGVPDGDAVIGEQVMIAWNGRAEVARAVSDALPIIARATRVDLLVVGEEHPDRPDAEQLRGYLRRHGIDSRIRRTEQQGPVGETILAEATALGSDLLVMGAYSHSRWREMIIGGVTRHAVHHSPIPLFLSH